MSERRPRRFTFAIAAALLGCALLGAPSAWAAAIWRVAPGGATSGCGSSWASPCSLQHALGSALSGDEIWVERGFYTPGVAQGDTFTIASGVAVYGGFAGTETVRSSRNPGANLTILSGDIDGNDANVGTTKIDATYSDINGSNSYNVVTMDGTGTPIGPATVLDGFTITGGDAAGSFPASGGGGLLCDAYGGGKCDPTLAHLVFSGNESGDVGGAAYLLGHGAESSPTLTEVVFTGNYATNAGGAIYADGTGGGVSNPTITDVTFSQNKSAFDSGGAIYDDGYKGVSSPTLTNVTFSGNHAGTNGGAMANMATYAGSSKSSPKLTNVTFSANDAQVGGAIFNDGLGIGDSTPTLVNVILWKDTAPVGSGPEIWNANLAQPTISYSVVEGSGGSGASWNTSFGVDGGHNLDANPMLGPLQNNGGFTDTMALLAGSSAIDAGDDGSCPLTDQRGVTRPQGPHCDIGAYEAITAVTKIPTLSPSALLLLALGLAFAATPMLLRRT